MGKTRLEALHAASPVIGGDWKGKLSPLLYVAAIGLTCVAAWLAQLIYVGVALLRLVPDSRIERALEHQG